MAGFVTFFIMFNFEPYRQRLLETPVDLNSLLQEMTDSNAIAIRRMIDEFHEEPQGELAAVVQDMRENIAGAIETVGVQPSLQDLLPVIEEWKDSMRQKVLGDIVMVLTDQVAQQFVLNLEDVDRTTLNDLAHTSRVYEDAMDVEEDALQYVVRAYLLKIIMGYE